MVNLNVPPARPDYAVRTLANECITKWGAPARPSEFFSGYTLPSATNPAGNPGNFSGHNADSNGICHAVDIFTGPGNIPASDGIWLANFLARRGANGDPRIFYVIHNDQIASAGTGWQFSGSGYGHFDHVHLSVCDLYWGDPVPIGAAIYDSTAGWGIASGSVVKPSGTTTTPSVEDTLAKLDSDDYSNIARAVWGYRNPKLEKRDAYEIIRQTSTNAATLARDWVFGVLGNNVDGWGANIIRNIANKLGVGPSAAQERERKKKVTGK